MSRPTRSRRVVNPPIMAGFKPFGLPLQELKSIQLHFDEYESINLVSYQNFSQDEAASRMGISRPTFTRIFNRAFKKIAMAFVEGLTIEIEGGPVAFDRQWFKCQKCFRLIDGLENHLPCRSCEAFGDQELVLLNPL